MKKPRWYTAWHRNPHSNYVHWGAFIIVALCATFVVITLTTPRPGHAQGRSSLLAAAGGYNVTPLGKVPEVIQPNDSAKGKTLQQQCQAKTAPANWGACCSSPDYASSEACQALMNNQNPPPANQPPADQANQDQIPQNVAKLLPISYQNEFSQLNQRAQQIQAQAAQLNTEAGQAVACENACPCGAAACGDVDQETGLAHDQCITSCDATLPGLMSRAAQLKKDAANFTKSADAFTKKVNTYKAKNKKKFRSIDGAKH